MKKLIVLLFSLYTITSLAQPVKKKTAIQNQLQSRIIGFLRWYKTEWSDTAKRDYRFIKGAYPDSSTKERIDMMGVEKYLPTFIKSGYVSESFINSLRKDFMETDSYLDKQPKPNTPVKTFDINVNFVLKTNEPKNVFDRIEKSTIEKCYIIYNKALVSLHMPPYPYIDLIFTLTKDNGIWLIDYVGYDPVDPNNLHKPQKKQQQ